MVCLFWFQTTRNACVDNSCLPTDSLGYVLHMCTSLNKWKNTSSKAETVICDDDYVLIYNQGSKFEIFYLPENK